MPTVVSSLIGELDRYLGAVERALNAYARQPSDVAALAQAAQSLSLIKGAGSILGIDALVTIADLLSSALDTAQQHPAAATHLVAKHLEGMARALRAAARAASEGRRTEPAVENAETLYAALLRDAGLDDRAVDHSPLEDPTAWETAHDAADDQEPTDAAGDAVEQATWLDVVDQLDTSEDELKDADAIPLVDVSIDYPAQVAHTVEVREAARIEPSSRADVFEMVADAHQGPATLGIAEFAQIEIIDEADVAVAVEPISTSAVERVDSASDEAAAVFRTEMEALLATLSGCLRALAKAPEQAEHVLALRDAVHSLVERSSTSGNELIAAVGHSVERLLDAHVVAGAAVDRRTFELVLVCRRILPSMLDHLGDLEAYSGLAQSIDRRAGQLENELYLVESPPTGEGDESDFSPSADDEWALEAENHAVLTQSDVGVDEPALLAVTPSVSAESEVMPEISDADERAASGFEATDELRTTFRAECAAHLEALRRAARDVLAGEDPASALREMMRITHTLKGAAAVSGCATVSVRCHALEDLLTGVTLQDGVESREWVSDVRVAIAEIAVLAAQWADDVSAAGESPAESEELERDLPATLVDLHNETRVLDGVANLIGELAIDRDNFERFLNRMRRGLADLEETANRASRTAQSLERRAQEERAADELGSRIGHNGESNGHRDIETPSAALGESHRGGEHDRLGREFAEIGADIHAAAEELVKVRAEFDAFAMRQRQISAKLEERLVNTRLLPLETIVPRLERAVRAAGGERGKAVQLLVEGGATSFEKSTLEAMAEGLLQLLRNAVDHGIESSDVRLASGKPAIGTITVRAYNDAHEAVVEVHDDGMGIERHDVFARARKLGWDVPGERASQTDALRMIFVPGFSTRDSADTLSGRGVGLDVVQAAAERLSGHISVDTMPGQGTTFRLRLPNASHNASVLVSVPDETAEVADVTYPEHVDAVADDPPAGEPVRRRVALVVDDSLSVRRVLGRALERHGWETLQARDGAEALELLAVGHADVVVTDIEMPRMNGFELIQAIRDRSEIGTLPIVVLTSRAAEQHRDTALEIGATAYLVKPFREETLIAVLEQAVAA